MYGNLGFTLTMSALNCIDTKEIPFILPIELDATTRLKNGKERGMVSSAQETEIIKNTLNTFHSSYIFTFQVTFWSGQG